MNKSTINTDKYLQGLKVLKTFLKTHVLIFSCILNIFLLPAISHALTPVIVAGNGVADYSGDGDLATSASLNNPWTVTANNDGNLFIADTLNHRVRHVDGISGIITTVAGSGELGFSGDGGPATSANISNPHGVALDKDGNLFFCDLINQCIRRVDANTGNIATVAGNGISGYSGDGDLATSASLYYPFGIDVDDNGNLFIADTRNHRIRRVDAITGVITTVAGTGTSGFSGDDGPATSAVLNFPYGVTVDGDGNLFIADLVNQRIRRVDGNTRVITTIVNNPGYVYNLSVDGAGNVFYVTWNYPNYPAEHGLWKWDMETGESTMLTVADGGLGIGIGNTDVYVTSKTENVVYQFAGIADPGNQPPVADAGHDQTVECTSSFGALVALDGSGSNDPDGDILTYTWDGPFGTATGVDPVVHMPMSTSPTIANVMLTVSDGIDTDTDDVFITIQDTTSPEVTARLVPVRLSERKGCFRVECSATDSCDTNPTIVANLNGISVTNGQLVELRHKWKYEVKTNNNDSSDNCGDVTIEGCRFILKVTATDASGNTGEAEDKYTFKYYRMNKMKRNVRRIMKRFEMEN